MRTDFVGLTFYCFALILLLSLLSGVSIASEKTVGRKIVSDLTAEQINQERLLIKAGDKLSEHQAVIIAQDCLLKSEHAKDYDYKQLIVGYDKEELGRPAWFIGFSAGPKADTCMYGAIVFEDGKENACQCLYGM